MDKQHKGSCLCGKVKFDINGEFESFCNNCGAALPSRQMVGKLLVVPAGSIENEIDIKPNAHIFCSSRANWDTGFLDVMEIEKLPS